MQNNIAVISVLTLLNAFTITCTVKHVYNEVLRTSKFTSL